MRLFVLVACLASVAAFRGPAPLRAVSARVSMLQQMPKIELQQQKRSLALHTTNDVSIVSAGEKKSLIDTVWNENTKIWVYLGVWYLGNIYCKYPLF